MSAARIAGSAKYFTGRPCTRGHIEPRYTVSGVCMGCQREASKIERNLPRAKQRQRGYYEKLRAEQPEVIMWRSARLRAEKLGMPFAITPEDILAVWHADDVCPVLGIGMRHNFDGKGSHADDSPSLDRIRPEFGYVKGNIVVISFLANRLKGDETNPNVFRRIADWLESVKGGA
ncbi:hypothetical protein [Burkholderia contaminans]|uniref:hypothetical protein n=1 Tax=Burkholderia contaminans TaxID=488447 RepID=UPI000F5B690F|nr:hypothetical protein [Burkholderia contaminans]